MRKPILITLFIVAAGVCVYVPRADAIAPKPPEKADKYVSPDRERCEIELAKDDEWRERRIARIRAEYKDQVRPDVHKEDTNAMLTNKRHVVMAYAALWILAVGFLALLWVRQQKLVSEIARLERDLSRAVEEE